MVIKCPRCGKEYTVSDDSAAPVVFRCEEPTCRNLFTVNLPVKNPAPENAGSAPASEEEKRETAPPAFAGAGQPASGGFQGDEAVPTETEEKKEPASPAFAGSDQPASDDVNAAKALAMDYFSDLPNVEQNAAPAPEAPFAAPAPETPFAAPTQETPAAQSRREAQAEALRHIGFTEETHPELAEAQRQQLLQLAKETEKENVSKQEAVVQRRREKIQIKKKMEKKTQRTGFRILLALAVLIPLVRIVFTRIGANVLQFTIMQSQLVPSLLYFCAALILLFHLVRRTYKPQWTPAALLLLPLVLDAWYLILPLAEALSGTGIYIISIVKLVISIFALVMSVKASKYPARKYHDKQDEPPEEVESVPVNDSADSRKPRSKKQKKGGKAE